MANEQVFSLPELGEGIKEGTVISLLVKEGDAVNEGDTVVEIETDKAVLGVPINLTGNLIKWHIKEGDTLTIGQKLLSLDILNGGGGKQEESTPNTPVENPPVSKEGSSSTHGGGNVELEVNFDGLGEGEEATIISLSVKEGDTVSKGDTLLEIETDKAVVPFPAPEDGVIIQILVKEGQEVTKVDKGFLLSTNSRVHPEPSQSEKEAPTTPGASVASTPPVTAGSPNSVSNAPLPQVTPSSVDYTQLDFSAVHAGPATRKMARELGVNLTQILGSGRNGRISVEDVKNFAKKIITGSSGPVTSSVSSKDLPDFSQWGGVRREKISKLRDTIAQSISYSWQAIPHVHQNDNVLIDNILSIQKKWKQSFEDKGSTLSVTPFVIKALAQCLKDFPQFNSSYDLTNKEIIFKEYFNIGVAVDTPQGLIVPVIKGVNQLSIFEIGVQLKTLSALTRERKVKPEDLRGACISVSNLGGIGGTHFNPIVNWPEVAILGVGRGRIEPIYQKEQKEFHPGMVLPICLAYDHRVIDGADGARFIVKLKHYLENPDHLLMGGI